MCSVIQSPDWTWSPTRYECSFSCSAMKRAITVTPICPAKRRTTWKNAENVSTRDGEPRAPEKKDCRMIEETSPTNANDCPTAMSSSVRK